MRIAILSDIHSNFEALLSVLKHLESQGVDKIFCLGDIIGYGPWPSECLEAIRRKAQVILMGNHEYALFDSQIFSEMNSEASSALSKNRALLSEDQKAFIRTLPRGWSDSELDTSLGHGAYCDFWSYVIFEENAKLAIEQVSTKFLLIGHTHRPFIFGQKFGFCDLASGTTGLPKDDRYVINVGSVGQPRDGDCRACYVTLDIGEDECEITFHRVDYDISKTFREMEAWGYPRNLCERLYHGL